MKVAVASDDKITVTGHVGRCNGFIIFTIENGTIVSKEYRENIFTNHRMHNHENHHGEKHGHGHHGLIDGLSDCNALIFNHGGMRLIEDLEANNITPLITDEVNAESAVLKYISGELTINEENVCHGHEK